MDPEAEQQARDQLPEWHEFVGRLIDLSRPIGNVPVDLQDAFARMAVIYMYKQTSHLEAMKALGSSRDCQLVARSMLEGVAQLVWAEEKPKRRATQWWEFAVIHDWRVMRLDKARGRLVSEDEEQQVLDNLAELGGQFLKSQEYRVVLQSNEGIPPGCDPFHGNWTKQGPSGLFAHLIIQGMMPQLTRDEYAMFSDWHHWSPGGAAQALHVEDYQQSYIANSATAAALCLSLGFGCLLQVSLIADRATGAGKNQDLLSLDVELTDWLRSVMPSE